MNAALLCGFDFSHGVILCLLTIQRLLSELGDAALQVESVRDEAQILISARGGSSRELVEPKLEELNRNFEKVSQHIRNAKASNFYKNYLSVMVVQYIHLKSNIKMSLITYIQCLKDISGKTQ